jgi:hypothetical protein
MMGLVRVMDAPTTVVKIRATFSFELVDNINSNARHFILNITIYRLLCSLFGMVL